jgi:exonuclease III
MSRQFNIISFNIQGLSSHKHVEIKTLNDNNSQIDICIQETRFIENYIRTIPGFRSEFKFFSSPNTPKNYIAEGLA